MAGGRRTKQYPCPVCQKAFPYPSNLAVHVRTHTGEKPYTCTACGMKFTQKISLKKHERTHVVKSQKGPYANMWKFELPE